MSLALVRRAYPKVRAPRCHGSAVVEPPFSEAANLVHANRTRRSEWNISIGGEPLGALIDEARADLVEASLSYTQRYRDVSFANRFTDTPPLVVCGHQPELFHAGVWFKNFALHRIARDQCGIGIHLLIDNDLLRQRNLRVPAGTPDRAEVSRIAFDDPVTAVPYEEAHVENDSLLRSFPTRVADSLRPFVAAPLLTELWTRVIEVQPRRRTIGAAFAEARHLIERDWGLETLEVPLSQLCQSRVFRLVSAKLLTELDCFQSLYNSSLMAYRSAHHLRSQSHPVPALTCDGHWLEAPFWIWNCDRPERKALYVRRNGHLLQLRAGRQGPELEMAALDDAGGQEAVDNLAQLEQTGVKIRPRALITTMYVRMFLSDLFLHGIGGGKYDQLTDQLMDAYWHIEPPEFMVMSATVRLATSRPLVEVDDIRQVDGLLRQLWFHPEFADGDGDGGEFELLARRKSQLVASPPPPGARKSWHDQIDALNVALREMVKAKRKDLLKEKSRLSDLARHDQHLASREYSFSLFPESRLKKTLLDLSTTIA